MARKGLIAAGALCVLGGAVAVVWAIAARSPTTSARTLSEEFDRKLDDGRWVVTHAGDFGTREVQVDADAPGRLRVSLDTIGTRDDSVKHLGARTANALALGQASEVIVDLDWNDQANGSYLSAGMVLSPHATEGNPLDTDDWLRVAYVGVPPGQSARLVVAEQRDGTKRTLFDDGWPDPNRLGRRIAQQRIAVVRSHDGFRIEENGVVVYRGDAPLAFTDAYLYLQASSHSNYRERTVYFDNAYVR